MSPKERNKNTRYFRIRLMWKVLAEHRLKTDFCFQCISDFFCVEETTIRQALAEDVVADVSFKHYELDRQWVLSYIQTELFSKNRNRKTKKSGSSTNQVSIFQ